MAADAKPTTTSQNGIQSSPAVSNKPIELAITLPSSPGTTIHLQLTLLAATTLLFLTSTSLEIGSANAASMGSFVMGFPDVRLPYFSYHGPPRAPTDVFEQRYNPSAPLSTALYTLPPSLDFTTRMAKLLARRTGMPCYVGGSIDLSVAAGGGSVEEEMAAFRAVVDVVTDEVAKVRGNA